MEAYRSPLMHLFLMALLWSICEGFYIPGVAPTEYTKGEKLDIRVTRSWHEGKSNHFLFNAHLDNTMMGCNVFVTGSEDDQREDTVAVWVLYSSLLPASWWSTLQVAQPWYVLNWTLTLPQSCVWWLSDSEGKNYKKVQCLDIVHISTIWTNSCMCTEAKWDCLNDSRLANWPTCRRITHLLTCIAIISIWAIQLIWIAWDRLVKVSDLNGQPFDSK